MYECERCGESVFTPEQSREASRKVKSLVRERLGLLPPEAIVGIRKGCNLSQEELERLFGLGKKVVVRWERGRVLQSKTADVLLRLMDQNPAIVEDMRKIHPKPLLA
jgi:HTH-type transcriptional regulator/antitoxin MqsA